jgi:G3E family GTPase
MSGAVIAGASAPELVMLTGALGSGKTSLISEYLALPDTVDTGVIVNDAGEINVDGAIIESGQRDLSIARLSNGCICCSVGENLKEAVDELLLDREQSGESRLRKIILETSGLARPGPIVRSIRNIDYLDFRLRIVSTCDASSPGTSDDTLPEYAAQLAAAHAVILTKTDLVGPSQIGAALEFVRGVNPLAVQVAGMNRDENARTAFNDSLPPFDPSHNSIDTQHPKLHPRVSVVSARWEQPVPGDVIFDWLEDISGFCGDRLLRVKGIVTPAEASESLLINGIGEAFGQPQRLRNTMPNQTEGLTLILRDTNIDDLREFGVEVSTQPPLLSISPH